MTLEHLFQQIARKNDLTNVSFGMSVNGEDSHRFTVTLHWSGYSRASNPCEFGYGPTFEAALEDGLKNVRRDRDEEPTVDLSGLLKIAA